MALGYRGRKWLSLLVLVIGVPVYIIVAVNLIDLMDRPPIWAELLVYAGLGLLWALPFRLVFRGMAYADPNETQGDAKD